tara:strand:+ start:239 stop:1486 length:1248 start_codon:yes stop_codon:yes gene_type:complete
MKIRAKGTKPQNQLVNSSARFPAMVAGFGAGKTQALMLRTLKLIFGEGQDIAYYLPSYPLVRTIAYPRFGEMLDNLGVPWHLNKAEHTIQVNGKTIIFRTMDNPDAIVGYEVGDSMVDELDTLPKDKARDAWNKIIARNRQKKKVGINTVAVGTTPEGFRFVYEKWAKDPTESYELIKAPTYSNKKNLPDGYIEALRETYPSNLLQAYLEGEFVNLTAGVVYTNYDRNLCNTDAVAKGGEPLHIGMDFNVNNMAAGIHVMRSGIAYAVDEIIGAADTPAVIDIIKSRYPNHAVIVYPDASGAASSSTNASMSDIKMLKNAGFSINAPRKNGRIRDRVAAVNKALCDPQGNRSYYVNVEKCPNIALGLEQQAYDKNGGPDKTGGFDHLNDGVGYFIVRQFPITFNRIIAPQPERWS